MLTQENIRNIPVAVDFVAVPSNFDIEYYMSFRETAGMFEGKETYLEHVKFVAQTVAGSPWFVLSKVPEITIQSAFLCLELFRQIGLTLDTNFSHAEDSKFRGRTWETQSKHWEYNPHRYDKEKPQYEAGHISQEAFVMVIINAYKLVEEGMIGPITERIVEVENRITEALEAQDMLEKK